MNPTLSIHAAPRIGAADLPQHAADAVQRALATRQAVAELSPEEVAQVSGALNLNFRIWAGGPFLPPFLPGLPGLPSLPSLPAVQGIG